MIADADLDVAVGQGPEPLVSAGVLQLLGNFAHPLLLVANESYSVTSTRPWRTKGGRTTRAGSIRSRTSTSTCLPTPLGTRAKPIERARVGENVPLVTSPSPSPGATTR